MADPAERPLEGSRPGPAPADRPRPEHPPADRPPPDRPPPAGWQQPGVDDAPPGLELEPLLALLGLVAQRVPSELSLRLSEAVRELALALRALLDAYLQRSEPGGPEAAGDGPRTRAAQPPEVRDIPIA